MNKERRHHRGLVSAALLLSVGLVATGCMSTQTTTTSESEAEERTEDITEIPIGNQTPVDGGRLVVGINNAYGTLDPTFNGTMQMRQVAEPFCEKLYDLDAAGNVAPMLATELPAVSDDGLTVDIPVRTGIQFADGTPFDAEAVAVSLRRHFEAPKSARTSEMGPITSINATDDATVRITFGQPFAPIAAILADRSGMIMSPTALQQLGDNFGDQPVCVGPFKVSSEVPQTSVTMVADPLYYDAAEVHLDEIEFRVIVDDAIRSVNLQSGDIDIASPVDTTSMTEIMSDANLQVMQTPSLGNHYFQVNIGNQTGVGTPAVQLTTPLAENPDIRRAISMSIDRQGLVDAVFDGWYDPACSPISPTTPFATEASEACVEYDPEAAKQLLADAGVTTPFPIEMLVANQPQNVRVAQALQAQLAQGGFELSIVPIEGTALVEAQRSGGYETVFQFFSGRIDPQANVNNYLQIGAMSNFSGYANQEVDDLLRAASGAPTTEERAQLYGDAITLVHQDNPIIYVYRMRNLVGVATDVAGLNLYNDGLVRVGRATLVEGTS